MKDRGKGSDANDIHISEKMKEKDTVVVITPSGSDGTEDGPSLSWNQGNEPGPSDKQGGSETPGADDGRSGVSGSEWGLPTSEAEAAMTLGDVGAASNPWDRGQIPPPSNWGLSPPSGKGEVPEHLSVTSKGDLKTSDSVDGHMGTEGSSGSEWSLPAICAESTTASDSAKKDINPDAPEYGNVTLAFKVSDPSPVDAQPPESRTGELKTDLKTPYGGEGWDVHVDPNLEPVIVFAPERITAKPPGDNKQPGGTPRRPEATTPPKAGRPSEAATPPKPGPPRPPEAATPAKEGPPSPPVEATTPPRSEVPIGPPPPPEAITPSQPEVPIGPPPPPEAATKEGPPPPPEAVTAAGVLTPGPPTASAPETVRGPAATPEVIIEATEAAKAAQAARAAEAGAAAEAAAASEVAAAAEAAEAVTALQAARATAQAAMSLGGPELLGVAAFLIVMLWSANSPARYPVVDVGGRKMKGGGYFGGSEKQIAPGATGQSEAGELPGARKSDERITDPAPSDGPARAPAPTGGPDSVKAPGPAEKTEPLSASGGRFDVPLTPAQRAEIEKQIRDHQPLTQDMKDALRSDARFRWREASKGEGAQPSPDWQVHHVIPLEYAHLFPDMYPNDLSNLVLMDQVAHARWHAIINEQVRNVGATREDALTIQRETLSDRSSKIRRLK